MAMMRSGLGRTVGEIGEAAGGLSEVFVPNATRAMELAAELRQSTLEAASAEFQYGGSGRFDRLVNGLNRLPRPMLALGTLGLFVYAMTDPTAFAARMVGLQEVPEPLWWLLGAIVSFYFGARELHYARGPGGGIAGAGDRPGRPSGRRTLRDRLGGIFRRRGASVAGNAAAQPDGPAQPDRAANPALSDWRGDAG